MPVDRAPAWPDTRFAPDPHRATLLDERMLRELGHSLGHVFEACVGVLDVPPTAALLCDALIAGTGYGPGVFRRYYDLVGAIQDDDLVTAQAYIHELCRAAPASPCMDVVELGDPGLGPDSARYAAMMDSDPSIRLGIAAPAAEAAAAFRVRLADGFALVERALPRLAGEIRAIIRQVVIVAGDPAEPVQFDGGSHYRLWGALFLNAGFHPDALGVAEVLAHESAHSLLFGFCTDEALVENPADALFASPLRADPRPMDGLYHATFVSARMHWAMARLGADASLAPGDRDRARAAAESDRVHFEAGYDVVREHGRLTATGRALMQGARAYMDTVS